MSRVNVMEWFVRIFNVYLEAGSVLDESVNVYYLYINISVKFDGNYSRRINLFSVVGKLNARVFIKHLN